MSDQNQPVKRLRVGGVSASVWRNETQQKGQAVVTHSVSIQKRYRDGSGQWQTSGSFFMDDLPKLELVVRKAYEFLALTAQGDADEVNS